MDKKEQEKLLTEIMDADAKDGLYEPTVSKMETTRTAVEWLIDWMGKSQYFIGNDLLEAFEQAKQIEKEQIIKAVYNTMEFDPNIEIAEKYYNKNYGK